MRILHWRRALLMAIAGLPLLGAPVLVLAAPAKAPAGKRASNPVAKHATKDARTKGPTAKARGRAKHARAAHAVAAVKGGLPNVQALGALVVDETGREIFARHPDKERPIASISKLGAALVVMDKGLELEGLTTITKDDIEVARGGARSRLFEGTTVSNRDLLHAALMGSDNRAIPALGRAVKLTPSQLTAAMNAKARELGLKSTRFREPTGLSSENVSTPRETITMLKIVMTHPVLGPITRRAEYDAHPVGRPPIRYINTDHPAARSNVQLLAGKTGYNDDARYCLVLAVKIDGRQYFLSFLANEGKLTRFGDVARVADWVIAHKPKGAGTGTGAAAANSSAVANAGASVVLPVGVAAPVSAATASSSPTANP